MYELFLTGIVQASDLGNALAILSGLCEMRPWSTINRVLHYQGPARPSGIPNQVAVDRNQRDPIVALCWRELHAVLARQSYVLHLRYELDLERDSGRSDGVIMDLNSRPAILGWTDFPDVPSPTRPLITQRKKIDIWDQRNLPFVMRDNNYRFKAELVEETYQFFREGVEFRLYRYRLSNMQEPSAAATPLPSLPSLEEMPVHDPEGRWFLRISTAVAAENKPDELREAQEHLMGVRRELDGLFEFLVTDRKVFDTRVAMEAGGGQVS